jgi:hypothetical protein
MPTATAPSGALPTAASGALPTAASPVSPVSDPTTTLGERTAAQEQVLPADHDDAGGRSYVLTPSRPKTRLQSGIVKPKKFTDGNVCWCNSCITGEAREPATVQEALRDSCWRQAMQDEYDALIRNGTWHLVPYKQSINLIDYKWVWKIKRRSDGTIDRYKGRLVAKSYKQRYGLIMKIPSVQ